MIHVEEQVQPHELAFGTRFPAELRPEDRASLLFTARKIYAVPARSAEVPRVYAYLSVEDALALGYDQEEPGELTRALLRAFPEMRGREGEVERRVRHLAWEYHQAASPRKGRTDMTPEDLTLDTAFEGAIRIEDTPLNERTLKDILSRLEQLGIHARSVRDGADVVLRMHLTIEEALRMGFNRHVPEELAFALEDAIPALGKDRIRLRHRIRELEWQYEGLRRAG